MSTRCPACGEFIGDNTFGKSPHHNCGKVIEWNVVELASTDPRDAQIAALTEKLHAVEAERDEARSGVKKSAEALGTKGDEHDA